MRFILAILNLLGYPGVGTYLAGHRRAGVIQIILHTVAFILSLSGSGIIIRRAWPHCHDPVSASDWLAGNLAALLVPLAVTILGLLIFFVNWLWSATTTKPASKTPPPLPVGNPK